MERILLRDARRLVQAAVLGEPWLIDDLAVVLFRVRRLAKSSRRGFEISCGHDFILRPGPVAVSLAASSS